MLYCGPYIKFFKCMTVIKYIFKTKIKAHKITIKQKKVKKLSTLYYTTIDNVPIEYK